MKRRKALVRLAGEPVGTLEEVDGGVRFTYLRVWLERPDAVPISLTLPLRREPYVSNDLHLKNFSLLTEPDGLRRLAPAYDLVCTRLVLPHDSLALPVGGKEKNLTRRTWLDLAAYCKLPEKAARRILDEQVRALEPSLTLIDRSFLPDRLKEQYAAVVQASTSILAA